MCMSSWKSSYCNHVMALLHELAGYSLDSFEKSPPCTSQSHKWGVPGDKEIKKEPVMRSSIISKGYEKQAYV